MKSIFVQTHDGEHYHFKNVYSTEDNGDFYVIRVKHENGMRDTHRLATSSIKRLSFYNTTGLVK